MRSRLSNAFKSLGLMLRSIRFRLTLWSVAILAIILLAFSVFVYTRQAADLQVFTQSQLEITYQQIQDLFRFAGMLDPEGPHITAADLNQRETLLLEGNTLLAVVGANGQTLQSMGGIDGPTINQSILVWQNANQPNQAVAFTTDLAVGQKATQNKTYRFLVAPITGERGARSLVVLGRMVDPEGQLPRLAFTLGISALGVLALVLFGGYWLAGRALAPVRTITRTARGISETGLHNRLHLSTQDELGELANTFDAMLDRLEAAFDRQRQFTADASHELRTPLTIVSLEADHALARRRTADEYERTLGVIKSENEYMTHLVGDLLTLARMDAGQTQLKLETLDVSDLALDVVERLSGLARRDNVELITGDLPEINLLGDRQFLSQMFTNLIENAIKYASSLNSGGDPHHVWVDTGCVDSAPQYAWVKVADDGPGIPAEDLPHLFDRFYRVDKARAREDGDNEKIPEGSGLGLSIVNWIAQAHHGQVLVQSQLGKGTTFEIRLPVA
ncbi:MAG TPA: ATP-binding protein [Anaerolineaceae bacterium]